MMNLTVRDHIQVLRLSPYCFLLTEINNNMAVITHDSCHVQTPLTNTVVMFRKVQHDQVGTEYTHKLYMCIQGTMVEIQTPAH